MQTKHVLSEIDPVAKRAVCVICGPAVIFTRVNDSGTIGHYCVRPVKKRTKWRTLHVLTDYDPTTKIANCSLCGPARTFIGTKDHLNPYCIGPVKVRKVWRSLHPISNIDEVNQVGDCGVCGPRISLQKRRQKGDKNYYVCAHGRRGRNRYRLAKGTECVRCGFVPEHWCQLDVDHIDGDHSNNSESNLQTLCANCHRMKTMESRQGFYFKPGLPREG
jgi:HNH endonuclease